MFSNAHSKKKYEGRNTLLEIYSGNGNAKEGENIFI